MPLETRRLRASRISRFRIPLVLPWMILLTPNAGFPAQIWTDGNGDGLPDSSPLSADPNTDVTVAVWVDSETFTWTNYYAYVEWTPGCIQYNSATYVISGGANYPIDASSYPNGVGFSGAGYMEDGIDHIGDIALTVLTPVTCCVTPIINPDNPYYVVSSLGAGTDYRLFEAVSATCYGEPGPLPGACCFPEGSCAFTTEAECVAAGGVDQGAGTQCGSANCQPPVMEACCFPDGSCSDLASPDECFTLGGTPQGDGSACKTMSCPLPTEACCLPTGYCDNFPKDYCAILGGVPQGQGTTCGTVICPQACCFADGVCQTLVAADCSAAGGLPQGPGSRCETTYCPPGACCFVDGTCQDLIEAECAAAGGIHQGLGSRCETTYCPPGACCFVDGTCQDLAEGYCSAAGGTYQGAGSRCETTYCPTPIGACCLWSGGCVDAGLTYCQSAGTWQGPGTSCAAYQCPPHTLFTREVADASPNDVGRGLAMALDPAGRPAMVYHDYYTGYTQFAYKAGGAWTIEVIDENAPLNAQYLGIAVDQKGAAHVTQMVNNGQYLQYAKKEGGAWTRETIAAPPLGVGYSNSLALASDGSPRVSYGETWRDSFGYDHIDLFLAQKQAGVWTKELVESARGTFGSAGYNSSLVLDVSGEPHIAHVRTASSALRYSYRSDGVWNSESLVYAIYATQPSLALDEAGTPHIAYYDYQLDGLTYASRINGAWVRELVSTSRGPMVTRAPLTFGSDGRPYIAFAGALPPSSPVYYARKDGSGWVVQIVDETPGFWFFHVAAALDGRDRLHVGYMEWNQKDVLYARATFGVRAAHEGSGGARLARSPSRDGLVESALIVAPNPIVAGEARIVYRVPEGERADLGVYDIEGRRLASIAPEIIAGNRATASWRAVDHRGAPVASGVYFLRLTSANGYQVTERVVIVR